MAKISNLNEFIEEANKRGYTVRVEVKKDKQTEVLVYREEWSTSNLGQAVPCPQERGIDIEETLGKFDFN